MPSSDLVLAAYLSLVAVLLGVLFWWRSGRVKSQLDDARQEFRDELAGARGHITSLRQEVGGFRDELRAEFRGEIASMRQELGGLKDDLRADMRSLHTEMATVRSVVTQIALALRPGGSQAPGA